MPNSGNIKNKISTLLSCLILSPPNKADDLDRVAIHDRRIGVGAAGDDGAVALDGDFARIEAEFGNKVTHAG